MKIMMNDSVFFMNDETWNIGIMEKWNVEGIWCQVIYYLTKYPAEKKPTQCFNENGAVIPKPAFFNGITPPV
jgi:hypothetical protein